MLERNNREAAMLTISSQDSGLQRGHHPFVEKKKKPNKTITYGSIQADAVLQWLTKPKATKKNRTPGVKLHLFFFFD